MSLPNLSAQLDPAARRADLPALALDLDHVGAAGANAAVRAEGEGRGEAGRMVVELFESAEAILHKIEHLPFEQIGEDVRNTIQSIEKLVNSAEITDAIKSLSDSLAQTEQLTKQMNEEIAPEVTEFRLEDANDVLISLKQGDVHGAAVLRVSS